MNYCKVTREDGKLFMTVVHRQLCLNHIEIQGWTGVQSLHIMSARVIRVDYPELDLLEMLKTTMTTFLKNEDMEK